MRPLPNDAAGCRAIAAAVRRGRLGPIGELLASALVADFPWLFAGGCLGASDVWEAHRQAVPQPVKASFTCINALHRPYQADRPNSADRLMH